VEKLKLWAAFFFCVFVENLQISIRQLHQKVKWQLFPLNVKLSENFVDIFMSKYIYLKMPNLKSKKIEILEKFRRKSEILITRNIFCPKFVLCQNNVINLQFVSEKRIFCLTYIFWPTTQLPPLSRLFSPFLCAPPSFLCLSLSFLTFFL